MQPRSLPTKRSYGVLLCTYNARRRCVNMLVVRRRVTYDFYDFITRPAYKASRLIGMLNNMTAEEKLDLLSLDFSRIYYRLFGLDITKLTPEHSRRYLALRDQFSKRFKRDQGRQLRSLIAASNSIDSIWEVPKGHRMLHESRLNCALREFQEETGIGPQHYSLVSPYSYQVSHISNGTKYESHYYIAMLNTLSYADTIRIDYNNYQQLLEVVDIRWVSTLDTPSMGRLHRTTSQLMRHVRALIRASTYTSTAPAVTSTPDEV